MIDENIFRFYDIRGLVDVSLTPDVLRVLGQAIGTKAKAQGQQEMAVGGDGRLSTPVFRDSLIEGLLSTGVDVIDIGQVPTPLLYYATHRLSAHSGVMVTGSHNPPNYNGLKVVIDQQTLTENAIAELRDLIKTNQFSQGQGRLKKTDLSTDYIEHIVADVKLVRRLTVAVDCGNGAAGVIAPKLLHALGCDVIPMYCEIDGRFPNHHPDPADPANMSDLSAEVQSAGADIGIAFDGDGDRLGVVTNSGRIIAADRILMLFSQQLLEQYPGSTIIYDVKCSRHLTQLIKQSGGIPIMWRTGHSGIKAKIRETGALFGGEYSGHICFADRWYGFDDALYSATRLLEILAIQTGNADELFKTTSADICTPEIKINTTEEAKFSIIEKLVDNQHFQNGAMNTIDGIRIDYVDGWGLIRASNTSPTLTLRFEAETKVAMARIRQAFAAALTEVAPHLNIPEQK